MTDKKTYDIEALLDEVVTLPTIPDSLARITSLINDPDCSLGDVAKAIAEDPAIAIKILRLVNSAYYGLGQHIDTVEHAVVLLGVKVVKNLTLTATVFDTMKNSTSYFHKHSVGCGIAMKALAGFGPLSQQLKTADEAFVFGLLHDIGKVIFEEYLPAYDKVELRAADNKIPWCQAERDIIGVDHAELGAELARRWKLSDTIEGAIAGHHDLAKCPEESRVLAANLCVADYICSVCGFPSHANPRFDIPQEIWSAAGLTSEMAPEILGAFLTGLSDVEELLALAA